MQVFEESKRSVPVFNDKHFSYNWDDSKWMFDKSRELKFPLSGGCHTVLLPQARDRTPYRYVDQKLDRGWRRRR